MGGHRRDGLGWIEGLWHLSRRLRRVQRRRGGLYGGEGCRHGTE